VIKETASIEIAVKGMNQVNRLTQKLELSSKSIDKVNKLLAGKKGRGSIFADYLDGVKLSVRSTNSLNKNLALAQTNFNKVALGTKSATIAARDFVRANRAVADGLRERNKLIEEAERVVASERFRRGDLSGDPNAYSRPIGPRPSGTKSSGRGNPRFNRGNFGNIASSAIIGGSFPLLFGQTGAAAVGGGLGGLAGGAIGGQFGFALSILGTAIGSAIDQNEKFNKSLAVLNVQFSKSGTGSKLLASDIDKLAKKLNITKEEAIAAFSAFREFGSSSAAKSLISIFGTDSASFDLLAATNRQAALAQQIFDARKDIGNEVAKQLLQQNLINNQSVVELALAEAKAKAANDEAIAKAKVVTLQDRILAGAASDGFNRVDPSIFGQERAQKLQEEFDKNRAKRLEDLKNSLREVRELLGLVNEAQGKFGQSGVLAVSSINDKVKDLTDEMLRLQDPVFQLISASEVIATSFSTSFKDIIRGTKTVQQAFADMFQRIADHFLDMAAQMMAASIQKGILGLFSGLGGGGIGGGALPPAPVYVAAQGGFSRSGGFKAFQSGGVVNSPTMGMVGEGGEPEYIIPASKMDGAMSRYSAGARGGAVIPGGSGDSGTVAGSSGNAIVEYTGPVLNFNGDEYVPKSAVPEIINTAAKRGGEAGQAKAFATLKNSRSQRATLGL
tara:strand:+ start:124 stop:2145 length:2022 start_codon:yes stop_codon:yes gene_type:complete